MCMSPFLIKKRNLVTGEPISVPCGKCPKCKKRKVSEWSFRLMQQEQSKTTEMAWFLTLTYDTPYLPISRAGYMTLNKKHVQDFMKRLRKRMGDNNQKYFAVGEYGSEGMRPHYHLILFNASAQAVSESWMLGATYFGTVTGASVGYVLKYMLKDGKIPMHRNDDREPEFRLMSKGLGANYLTDNMLNWHHADKDNRMYCNIDNGKKISMPRYYKDRIYSEIDRKRIGFHQRFEQLKRMYEQEENDIRTYGDLAPHVRLGRDREAYRKASRDSRKGDKL